MRLKELSIILITECKLYRGEQEYESVIRKGETVLACRKRVTDTFVSVKDKRLHIKLATDNVQYCSGKAGFGYGAGERAHRRELFPVIQKKA